MNIHKLQETDYNQGQTMASTTENQKILYDCLHDNNTDSFYIEYDTFMSNHVSHGIVALHGLGADRGRLQQFVDWYSKKLESSDGETATDQSDPRENQDGVPRPGTRHSYYKLLVHYTQRLETHHGGDLRKFVGSEFPALSLGLAGSALHGLIHLGYGYSCGDTRSVCEGMAYLHHSYLPPKVPSGVNTNALWEGSREIFEVLEDVRGNKDLLHYVIREAKLLGEKGKRSSFFQNRVRVLFTNKTEELLRYATQIKLPDFAKNNCSLDEALQLGRWLLDSAVHVYVRSEAVNEFFLLHGVTGAWSLCQLLTALRDPHDVISACVTFFITLLAAYIAEKCPALNKSPESYRLKYKDWSEIMEAALAKECDEHIYKLVQVTKDMSKDCADQELLDLYKIAANIALTHDLSFPST